MTDSDKDLLHSDLLPKHSSYVISKDPSSKKNANYNAWISYNVAVKYKNMKGNKFALCILSLKFIYNAGYVFEDKFLFEVIIFYRRKIFLHNLVAMYLHLHTATCVF